MCCADEEQLKKLVKTSQQAHGEKHLVLAQFASDLRMLDPLKTPQDIETYLRRATQVSHGEMPETMEPEAFLHNLLSLGVCKPGTLARVERRRALSLAAALGDIAAEEHRHVPAN
jgi:hypothetical protein